MMNLQRKLLTSGLLMAVLSLGGCWNDDDDSDPDTPVTASEVPESAGISTSAFIAFLRSLSASDESSEPLIIKESFRVPADESGDSTPLT